MGACGRTYTCRSTLPRMDTPPTENATKTVRVSESVHARLQNLIDTTGCTTHNDAISLLMTNQTLRLVLGKEQRARWDAYAKEAGQPLPEFVISRVEAAIGFGVDPGALRRIHDMTYALCRAAGINPQQLSTPGARRQIVTAPVEPKSP